MPKEGDACVTADGRKGYLFSSGIQLECIPGDSFEAVQASQAASTETMSERVARLKKDPQGVSANTSGESGGQAPGSDGSGASKSIDSNKAAKELGEKSAQVSSGALKGETVRETPAGRLAESNDVILGDQSTRANGPKEKKPEEKYVSDGSSSPHDSTSEGGSRQSAAHSQVGEAKDATTEAATNPAFRAEAKVRTI